jgi:hypothetical protein
LTPAKARADSRPVNFLLPQERDGTLVRVQPVDIHGDRYVDVVVRFDGEPETRAGRVSALECPPGLEPGGRVRVRIVMGVMTSVARAE